jgi:hypothetical protein
MIKIIASNAALNVSVKAMQIKVDIDFSHILIWHPNTFLKL